MERRLAAILFADVVGFSDLMHQFEDATHAAWKSVQNEIVDPLFEEYRGRIVKKTGDGFLGEFGAVIDAVNCAIKIQTEVNSWEGSLPNDRKMRLRIGINLGDIIYDGGDISGDGVNIASRLESLAEPGSVYVSGEIYNQVRRKIDFVFDDLGEKNLKNIDRPVRVWRWVSDESRTPPAPNGETERQNPRYKVKRDFDDVDISDFRKAAFETVQNYFQLSIDEINQADGLKARIRIIDTQSFTCTLVNRALERGTAHLTVHMRNGSPALGDIFFSYTENAPSNTANGGFDIESDNYELYLRPSIFLHDNDRVRLSPHAAAVILWNEFIAIAGISLMTTISRFRCNNCGERFDTEVLDEDEMREARRTGRPTYLIHCPKCNRTDVRLGWD